MSIYTKIIINIPNLSQEQYNAIEDVMRYDIFHSTLDWQGRMSCCAARRALGILAADTSPMGAQMSYDPKCSRTGGVLPR